MSTGDRVNRREVPRTEVPALLGDSKKAQVANLGQPLHQLQETVARRATSAPVACSIGESKRYSRTRWTSEESG